MNAQSQSKLPEIAEHVARVDFLKTLRLIDRFQEILLEGTAEELRAKVATLQAGRPLLQESDTISVCDHLIGAFKARLAALPHEMYLRRHLRDQFR